MRRRIPTLTFMVMMASLAAAAAPAATLSPTLASTLATAGSAEEVGVVIITFNTTSGLAAAHLDALRSIGIAKGLTLPSLGMVATPATAGQVRALVAHTAVRSIWSNDALYYDMHEARVLTGVDRLRADGAFTKTNGGLPISGRGNFSVVVNDSGIDGTHADLKFPAHVIQNVQVLTDTDTLAGFTPLLTLENVPNTDSHVGHGTHVAGIVGGTGQSSGGRFAGVAPGVNLIGTGSGAVLFILNAVGGFEWAITNQFLYNIRVISNSFGSRGAFNPDDPLVIATRRAVEQNIIVVFSAGNSGPGVATHNIYGKAPWVISVGAGTKEGGLVGFSSRGSPAEERLTDNDPNNDSDAPTLVAPGTGREFESDASRFTSDVVSTRAATNVVANGLTADLEIPPAFLPFYTQISGTSMSCPHVAGVVALMLDADPTLSVEEIKQILRETSTPMPGYEEFEVGAGYVNAFAAVDKVFSRTKPYGAVNHPAFNAQVSVTPLGDAERFTINFTPQTPGPNSTNTHAFTVTADAGILDVAVDFGTNPVTDEAGNTMGLTLHAPDGTTFTSGLTLPVLDATDRRIRIKRPVAGRWIAEVRGLRGVIIGGQPILSPVGIAVPERVDGVIRQFAVALAGVPDLAGHPDQKRIETMLADRRIDVLADGFFHPDAAVTREDFARSLALAVPLRQSLAAAPRFNDVAGDLRPFAEAATAKGSTLRDFGFTPDGVMSASGAAFDPLRATTRLDLAVAFVRALGRDADAKALANTTVMSGGQALTDNAAIPAALRGYVQIAIDKGLLETFPAEVREIAPGRFEAIPGPRFEPTSVVSRAKLATTIDRFAQVFRVE
ncbi:MAG: S8 family serine peptidase [Gammaproteobacteria bacterium]